MAEEWKNTAMLGLAKLIYVHLNFLSNSVSVAM